MAQRWIPIVPQARLKADSTSTIARSPGQNKTSAELSDTSYEMKVDNVRRFFADSGWSVLYGPSQSTSIEMFSDSNFIIKRAGTARIGFDATNAYLHGAATTGRLLVNDLSMVLWMGATDVLNCGATYCNNRFVWGNSLSDQRHKTQLQAIPDALLDAWGKHVDWGSYRWLDKGLDQREQLGVIAQAVKAAFDEAGIDWRTWRVVEHNEAEDYFGVTYDHCHAIEHAYQRRRLARIEKALGL